MGTTEIVFILLIYLLLFGTKGLPSVAQSMGKFMRQVRDAQQDIQREILSGTDDIRKGAAAFQIDQTGFEEAMNAPTGTPRSSTGVPSDGAPPKATSEKAPTSATEPGDDAGADTNPQEQAQ